MCVMTAPAQQLRDVQVEVIDELDIEVVEGRIHNAFDAEVEGEGVILLCGTCEHVDALQCDDAIVSATYLGTGSGGYPRYLVTAARAL